jgi:hypothetical protein
VRSYRRKVVLWSRRRWSDFDAVGRPGVPPGRFACGTTQTPAGTLRIAGVCIPWRGAHVSTGRRDRAPWADHLAYLDGLADIARDLHGPHIVLGDFNQRTPRAPASPNSSRRVSLHAWRGGSCRRRGGPAMWR